MAIYFDTQTPSQLLKDFKKAIDEGEVVTWSYDNDGDFTHTPDQWKHKAWLRPHTALKAGKLVFTIIKPNNENLSKTVYAVYHGRFIEAVLAHFDKSFTIGSASAMPADGDVVK